MQTSRTFRNRLFTIHTWLGLHLSIFFAFMFLTGSLLVIATELELIGRPAVWTTLSTEERTASIGDIYEGIKQTRPKATLWFVEKEPAPWLVDRTFATTASGESVGIWTDPTTGAVVEVTSETGFRSILRDLHDTFLTTKRPIFILITASSVILLIQLLSGLITYRRFWKGFFRWPGRNNASRSRIGSFHRLAALWGLPLVFLIAITSFYFLLGALGIEGTTPHPETASERSSVLPTGFGGDVIDTAEQHARNALPDFEPIGMSLPGQKSEGLGFVGYQSGVFWLRGTSSVIIDPVTFDVLGAFTPDDNSGLARWKSLMNTLHFGTWGGTFSLVLWVLLGFVLTGIAITGALIFAARTVPDPTNGQPSNALMRIWRGLGFARWIYLLVILGIIATAYQRYGPEIHSKAVMNMIGTPDRAAGFALNRPQRGDIPPDTELKTFETGGETTLLQPLATILKNDKARAHFVFQPVNALRSLSSFLQKTNGQEKSVSSRLGRRIW